MTLPFTPDQFFDVLGAYNHALWPAAVVLWVCAFASVVALGLRVPGRSLICAAMLAIQWAWAGVVYHAMFFADINPAAWLFAGLFVIESVLMLWYGVKDGRLTFSSSLRTVRESWGWLLIVYALLYPFIVILEGHTFPRMPTFGLPCPTTILTMGLLLVARPPWPRILAIVPLGWAIIGGSAALLLGVRTDLMLWIGGLALAMTLVPVWHRPVLS